MEDDTGIGEIRYLFFVLKSVIKCIYDVFGDRNLLIKNLLCILRNEIWIDFYQLAQFLCVNQSEVVRDEKKKEWYQKFEMLDLIV